MQERKLARNLFNDLVFARRCKGFARIYFISVYLCNQRHQCATLLHHRFQKLPGQ